MVTATTYYPYWRIAEGYSGWFSQQEKWSDVSVYHALAEAVRHLAQDQNLRKQLGNLGRACVVLTG